MKGRGKWFMFSRALFGRMLVAFIVVAFSWVDLLSTDFKVDRSIARKYSGRIRIIDEAREAVELLELIFNADKEPIDKRWRYNLFYPSIVIKAEVDSESSATGKEVHPRSLESSLIGVVVGKLGSYAIFADKAVKEGERIGEVKVVKVSLDGVLLETKEGIKEIVIR